MLDVLPAWIKELVGWQGKGSVPNFKDLFLSNLGSCGSRTIVDILLRPYQDRTNKQTYRSQAIASGNGDGGT